MKNFILILLAVIVALVVVGGVGAYTVMNHVSDTDDAGSALNEIVDKVSNVASSDKSVSTSSDTVSDDDRSDDSDNNVVSEEVKYNYQNDGGYYREVTYKDGGFRQYDTESGELIGSSYDSDQNHLPSME